MFSIVVILLVSFFGAVCTFFGRFVLVRRVWVFIVVFRIRFFLGGLVIWVSIL